MLQRLLQARRDGPGIEDWSTPLIARDGAPVVSGPASGQPAGAAGEVGEPSANPPPASAMPPRLRCLLVTSDLDAGGMDEVVVFLARRLPRHGVHTAVLHASAAGAGADGAPSGRLGRALRAEGVEVRQFDAVRGTAWLIDWRPDVISAHGAPAWLLAAANRLSIPCVETLHGMHSLFNADWAAEAVRSRQLTTIVAVSELVRRQYLNGNPDFAAERIVTIPNSVDDERRAIGDRAAARAALGLRDEYLFVCLARHCLQKNTYGLVAAFAEVAARHPQAHLLIAGRPDDPVYFSQVRHLREGLPCRARIHLRDHTAQPAALLGAADGFVLDSFFEGWSLASMEALHAGLPVVLSEVGGAREQVGEPQQQRGHLVANPAGDPLRVNWQSMQAASYRPQGNRAALVEAMSSLVRERAAWLDRRQGLIDESRVRFHPDLCLRAHAGVLVAARRLREG
jgi:glycosyltransferase involved in cell wall biosynthesis